jgi:hypothetical protein
MFIEALQVHFKAGLPQWLHPRKDNARLHATIAGGFNLHALGEPAIMTQGD